MPVQLFKLVMSATTSNRRVAPTVYRYFRRLNTAVDKVGTNSIVVVASNFLDDNGANVAHNGITQKVASNGYYLLFVNGVLQQTNLYTVSSSQLSIKSGAASLSGNAPVTLIVNNFAPDMDITVS